jgi:putative endonuclease
LVRAHPDNHREELFKKTLQQCKVFFVFTTFVLEYSSHYRELFGKQEFKEMNLVYILHSTKLDRFYIGYTSDFDVRLDYHLNSNESRKFTSKAADWITFLKIECQSKKQALQIEKQSKTMKSKVYIHNLKIYPEMTIKLLEKYKDC